MALLKIEKDDKVLTVTAGAYESQYLSAGWIVKEKISEKKEMTESEKNVDEWEEAEVEALLEKPISDLKFDELKTVAKYKGIDTAGLNGKQMREAIKNAM